MLQFEPTHDYDLVRRIITHPAVFEHMFSDGAIAREKYCPPQDKGLMYLLVKIGSTVAGLFLLVPQTSVCWEVHTCFLPALRGALAIQAYREGMEWLKANTMCRKVIGNTPAYNRAALAVAYRAGCSKIGVNTKSILKDGKLQDQVIIGKEL